MLHSRSRKWPPRHLAALCRAALVFLALSQVAHAEDDSFYFEPPDDFQEGTSLQVVTLGPDGTLAELAARFNVRAEDIRTWNRLEGAPDPDQPLALWLRPTAEPEPEPVAGAVRQPPSGSLFDPAHATATAPDTYSVLLRTTKGDIVIKVHRKWAPESADRFYNLVTMGYYDDVAFHRVIDYYLAQFGIHGSPFVNRLWREAPLTRDAPLKNNRTGFVAFMDSRDGYPTTEVFINTNNNLALDRVPCVPFGKVSKGLGVVRRLHSDFGGHGPNDRTLIGEGNAYLRKAFPAVDYITEAVLLQ